MCIRDSGLRDPVGYLNRLNERLLEQSPEAAPPYVLVEKILSRDELLPDDWQVSGTTGYEYLNIANGLFAVSYTHLLRRRSAGQLCVAANSAIASF